jgi:hypothetical protein
MRIVKIAKGKEWIGVDLDGTLASYTEYKGPEHIGEPIPKMVSRVKKWLDDGKTVKMFTARADGKDKAVAVKAIKAWCKEHLGQELEVTCKKDQFMTELWDDRAVRVKKNKGERTAESKSDPYRESLEKEREDRLLKALGISKDK